MIKQIIDINNKVSAARQRDAIYNSPMEENSIRWIGYEYEHSEKSVDWFWAIGIITFCVAIIAIIYNNSLFGIFILIAGVMTMFLAKRPPEIIEYALTPKGLLINKTLYLYKNVHSFWVDTDVKSHPELLIKTKKNLSRFFIIPIQHGTADPHEIRDYLLQIIPEEHMYEPLSHVAMKKLGL